MRESARFMVESSRAMKRGAIGEIPLNLTLTKGDEICVSPFEKGGLRGILKGMVEA